MMMCKRTATEYKHIDIAFRLLLLCAVIFLQVRTEDIRTQDITTASACSCEQSYYCNENRVCVKNCTAICINESSHEVCGSDGRTYRNNCTLFCEGDRDIKKLDDKPCVTQTPRQANLCLKHQNDYHKLRNNAAEYDRKCNYHTLVAKGNNKSVELSDLIPCYYPHCTNEEYTGVQCSFNLPNWCWCSDPNGIAIPGTLKEGLREEECNNRNSCTYQGRTYKDAAVFPHEHCGICECLNGVVNCFDEFVPSPSDGRLNSTQFEEFKQLLTELFFFQYNHKAHILTDIRHIYQHPTTISNIVKKTILAWKFRHFDRDSDLHLNSQELFFLRREIYSFIKCIKFFPQIISIMDESDDGVIDLGEWKSFFEEESQLDYSSSSGDYEPILEQPAKRSVLSNSRLKRLERKKFYYTLV